MYYRSILFFLFFLSLSINAQNLDSIFNSKKEHVASIKSDTEKVDFLYKSGKYFYTKSITKSEYFFKEVRLLSENRKNVMEGESLWQLGLIERKKGDLGTSLRYLMKAKEIFKEINDSQRFASIHFDIGYLYNYKNEKDNELAFYKKGFELSKNQKEKIIGKSYLHFGNYNARNKKLDSSIYYYNKALDIFKKLKKENRIYNVYNGIANTYYKQGKYDKVIKTRNIVLAYAKATRNKMLLTVNYHNIAAAYLKKQQYNTALKHIDSAIVIAEKEHFKVRLSKSYKSKYSINYNLNKHEEALLSYKKYKTYSDSIFKSQLRSRIKEIEHNKELEIEKKNLELLNQKQTHEKKLYLVIFSIFFFLVLILIIYLYKNFINKSKKINNKLKKETSRKEVLSQKFKTSESEIKQLVADNSMRLEFLKQLVNQIKEHKNTTDSIEVKNYIKELSLKIQQQITTENKLSTLQDKMVNVNQGFDKKIITLYPNLTKTEREICSFLRLNLSIKEIASIRNVSTDSIKTARYRIRKKINIPKEEELEHFIQNLNI